MHPAHMHVVGEGGRSETKRFDVIKDVNKKCQRCHQPRQQFKRSGGAIDTIVGQYSVAIINPGRDSGDC